MKVVAIIQARMGSTRLPGKVLMDIGGETVLARVVTRLSRAKRIDQLVIATTASRADDRIVTAVRKVGIECFRGPEEDVLSRYVGAAEMFGAEAIVRITSDCPLIDPELVDEVVAEGLTNGADYASNCLPASYPRGLDTEFFTIQALRQADRIARQPYQREHVTPVLYERSGLFKIRSKCAERDYSGYRWTLDTSEDLQLIRAIYAHFENRDDFTWREVLELMDRIPELSQINAHVMQKPVYEAEVMR